MKKLAKILALMLVLVMGVCMFTGCSDESKVEGLAEDFMDALADGDGDDAAARVLDLLRQAQNIVCFPRIGDQYRYIALFQAGG